MKIQRFFRQRTLLLGDLFLIIVCVLAAFVLRLNFGSRLADFRYQILTNIGIALVVKPIIYSWLGLYRRLWAYASVQEIKLIAVAVTMASVVMFFFISVIQALQLFPEFPRAAVFIDWLLSLIAVGGLRFSLRILAESQPFGGGQSGRLRRALIVGAGDAGALVARELQKSAAQPSLAAPLTPVGFADDDPAKQRGEIYGVPVIGALKDLPRLVADYRIQEVIFAIPSAPGAVLRSVTEVCQQRGIPLRTMPSIHELIGGKVSVSRLREVEITDLLRRQPAQIDDELVGVSLGNKRILVTGAGGSIGRELCRQIARWGPATLVLLGHGENSLFETLIELQENYASLPIHTVIADVRDADRLRQIFRDHRPQVVFHAAAHKHVPLMESNIEEAVTNNVIGTLNVVETALAYDADRLVLISTDKAVRPSSVMGATKRLAEMIVLDAARRSGKAYVVVRFGNVLGSRGSILPLFKRQIAQGGPVTITHPEMRRYFMTIPEAVHLVLQAFAMGKGGETFVLKMGDQIRILDLAEDLIRLSGLTPYKDIDIVFTGIRPGEKLSEELWDEGVIYEETAHPDIVSLPEEELLSQEALHATLDELSRLAQQGETEAILQLFDELIPGAAVRSQPPPDMTSLV